MTDHSDRIFKGDSTYPGQEEWYYRTREGIVGPYLRREDAVIALEYFVNHCKRNSVSGGRTALPLADEQSSADTRSLMQTLLWAARHLPRALAMRVAGH